MRGVFGKVLKKKSYDIFFSYCPLFDILDIANAIFRKVLVLKARNFYKLIEYNG